MVGEPESKYYQLQPGDTIQADDEMELPISGWTRLSPGAKTAGKTYDPEKYIPMRRRT
jgi:hypothetical protein